MFVFVARGFTNKYLRQVFAVLLGRRPEDIMPGGMSYELRRLRLHGLIERLPKTHRYRLTDEGLRTAMSTRACTRASCARSWRRPSRTHRSAYTPRCVTSVPPKPPSIHMSCDGPALLRQARSCLFAAVFPRRHHQGLDAALRLHDARLGGGSDRRLHRTPMGIRPRNGVRPGRCETFQSSHLTDYNTDISPKG